jgi:hypothetical protein
MDQDPELQRPFTEIGNVSVVKSLDSGVIHKFGHCDGVMMMS